MIKKLIIFAVLFCIFIPQNVYAQSAEEKLKSVKEDLLPLAVEHSTTECVVRLTPIFDADTIAFFEFLDLHYQNKKSTSSLNNIAVSKFYEYKKAMISVVDSLKPKASSPADEPTLTIHEFTASSICRELAESYIDASKEKMYDHIRKTNSSKKTTKIVEKYQAINDGLRDLNFKMAQMFGYFETFKNKLPFFVENCVKG